MINALISGMGRMAGFLCCFHGVPIIWKEDTPFVCYNIYKGIQCHTVIITCRFLLGAVHWVTLIVRMDQFSMAD